jgi:hypothetical protein
MAWVQRLGGLIKGGKSGSEAISIKVEDASRKQISIIDLNCYQIVL